MQKVSILFLAMMIPILGAAQGPKAPEEAEKQIQTLSKALALQGQKKFDEAAELYKTALAEDSNLREYVHFYYGQLFIQQEKWTEAKSQLEQVQRHSPNVKLQMESQFKLALIALEEKRFKEAKGILGKLEKRQRREESYPDTIYQLAKAERGLRNQPQACRWIRKLYTTYPQYKRIESWGPILSTDQFEGEPTKCSVTTEDRRKRVRALQWAALGTKAFEEIQMLRAQTNKAHMFDVDRLEVGYWLHEGEVTKALQLLLPYYEPMKKNVNYLNVLAVVAARAGEFQLAVGSYYNVYKVAPRGKHGRQALFQAAFMSYQYQDYDGAARKFQEFSKVYPGSGLSRDALWHLAWLKYLKGDYEGSLKSMQVLLNNIQSRKRGWRNYPKDRLIYWMAMAQFRQGKYPQAKAALENIAKDPLLGYYSVAAQARLKKIEKLRPKMSLASNAFPSRNVARFTFGEATIPLEEYKGTTPTFEDESEATIQVQLDEEKVPDEVSESTESEDVVATSEPMEPTQGEGDILPVEGSERKSPFQNPVLVKRFEKARDLMILGQNDWAKWELFEIEKRTTNRDYMKNLIQEYQQVENYHRSAYIAQISFGGQRALHGIEGVKYLWEAAYPQAYKSVVDKYSRQFGIPSEMVWSIMRAESVYKKDVISPVGALGLMQVMPGTGQKIADIMSEKKFEARQLLEPEMAVKMGSKYLQRLLSQFDRSVPLVSAGYNAGPHRVKSWIYTFGTLDLDEFIEHIPFLETRNYVKKVVSNYQIYSQLYSKQKSPLNYLSEPISVKVSSAPTKESWDEI